MKIIGYIILLVTCLSTSYAQQPTPIVNSKSDINWTDNKGLKQGLWKKYNKEGQLLYTGTFKNNYPIDTFYYYYPSSALKSVAIYSEQGKRAHVALFYEHGQPYAEGHYYNKQKDSVWFYLNAFKQIIVEEYYKNGVKHGISKVFYGESGKIAEEMTWANGQKEGVWKQYYENGQVKISALHKNNKRYGLFQAFNAEGVISMSGNYIDNIKDGLWVYFTPQQQAWKKEYYEGGLFKKEEILIEPPKEEFKKQTDEIIPEPSMDNQNTQQWQGDGY